MFQLIDLAHAQAVTQVGSNVRLADIMMEVINWIFAIGGGLAVIFIIYGGFRYMTAGSDENGTTEARNTITYAIIGIVIIALSFIIINWLASALDFARPLSF